MYTRSSDRSRPLLFSFRQWLFLSCCFSCLLVCGRIAVTGHLTYLSLVWNLFLAYVPYAISGWLTGRPAVMESRWKTGAVLLVWLLFIPNSFYIVTDLFHLVEVHTAPKWFDLLILFSFSWNGLLLGILSVRKTEMVLQVVSGRRLSLLFVFAFMWLNAFGIYLGRYLRYNSWDVVVQPFSLFGEMLELVGHPLQNKMEWSMVTSWSVFMTLLYITLREMAEHMRVYKLQ
ncbi:MAG: DUF1361 domain-containing protein [Chitinophagaceae bacterium]